MATETIRVFVPTGSPAAARSASEATRAHSAASEFVIGLLDNHKHNTDRVLARLEQHLAQALGNVRFVRAVKGDAGKGAGKAVVEDLAGQCRAVITGIGD